MASINTKLTIASAIGTALGHRHGSCLPLTLKFLALPDLLIDFCGFEIDEVGFKANLADLDVMIKGEK